MIMIKIQGRGTAFLLLVGQRILHQNNCITRAPVQLSSEKKCFITGYV